MQIYEKISKSEEIRYIFFKNLQKLFFDGKKSNWPRGICCLSQERTA